MDLNLPFASPKSQLPRHKAPPNPTPSPSLSSLFKNGDGGEGDGGLGGRGGVGWVWANEWITRIPRIRYIVRLINSDKDYESFVPLHSTIYYVLLFSP